MKRTNSRWARPLLLMCVCLSMSGCIGTAVGVVVDTAIEVVKIPFKVGGAIIDVVDGDDDFRQMKEDDSQYQLRFNAEQQALQMEQRGL